jgi:hypothetical protein
VPAVTDYAPPAAGAFGYPAVNVAPLYVPTDDWLVVSLAQEDRIRPTDQKLIPTIAVSFSVPGLPGVFTIRIDNYAFAHADVMGYMRERSHLIRALYALPGTLPPLVDPSAYGQQLTVALDVVTGVTEPDGSGAVTWHGSVVPHEATATARLEVTALGDADPMLVSDPSSVPPSDTAVPLSGTLGPLDPGRYTARLTADSPLGLGLSVDRAFSIL